jgi:predicted acyl esterase
MTAHCCQFQKLADVDPALARTLTHHAIDTAPQFDVHAIRLQTVQMRTRDGVRLATDLYLPPATRSPSVVMRTPYGRAKDIFVGIFLSLARRGYAVIAQDCRGSGDSEPDRFDYYMYEADDGFDCVDWVIHQDWFDGFVGSFGASYVGQTQWCMAMHPHMSTLVPQVSGIGIVANTTRLYMYRNTASRLTGKAKRTSAPHFTDVEREMEKETMAGGYFNESLHPHVPPPLLQRFPELVAMQVESAQRVLWERYCAMSGAERAELARLGLGTDAVSGADLYALSTIFGRRVHIDAHTIPCVDTSELCRKLQAPPLMITGWYDWCLNDALATWQALGREARGNVRANRRLIITPAAHALPGYREGMERHPELANSHRQNVELLLRWYGAVRNGATSAWPTVIYYLMGANEWRIADDWPVPGATQIALYLGPGGMLTSSAPSSSGDPDRYRYDPDDPTPTVGGSIVSYLYPTGSVDVSTVQKRDDVRVYSTPPLDQDIDVIGPISLILYASSSARDTDFVARLSDVFPDGRAIQIQSGILRARYRKVDGPPQWLEPDQIYRLEIDLWATANRFKKGHRLRLDISSADFPKLDRNSNRAGEKGDPLVAHQAIYHDREHPSHLLISTLTAGSPHAGR